MLPFDWILWRFSKREIDGCWRERNGLRDALDPRSR
jgi:hypothetical protein